MKNKKLIGLLIVLAFITVLVVLNSTLFTLQSISVNWLTTKCELETLKDYTMVDSIEKGESIFSPFYIDYKVLCFVFLGKIWGKITEKNRQNRRFYLKF